ncbi:MAG: leucine-rich repeat domain-containing protein [Alphaproteobacteria bacterium]|nr:leucine-rich repeat domain-containing protein [Alphaproteobacteria bacterium]
MKRFIAFFCFIFLCNNVFSNENNIELFLDELKNDIKNTNQEVNNEYYEDIKKELIQNNMFYFDGKGKLSLKTIELLCNIENLTDLYVRDAGLKFIPDAIQKLSKLKTLDLSYNELMELPEVIGNMRDLDDINLDHNRLSDLPETMVNLKKLSALSLKGNKFQVVPAVIQYFSELLYLNLDQNNLLNVPSFIAKLQKLDTLTILENPAFQMNGQGDHLGKMDLAKLFIKKKDALSYKEKYKDFYNTLRPATPKIRGGAQCDAFRPYFGSFQSPKIIMNHDKFEGNRKYPVNGVAKNGQLIKGGNTLTYTYSKGKEYPIGYSIHFPENEVKAIRVDVYGGKSWDIDDFFSDNSKMQNLNGSNAYLARNGVMIIKLLLRDLIDSDTFQGDMEQDYMKSLQVGINHFWNILTNNPEDIHEDLRDMRLLPKYLYGASFGGLTSLFQATEYPRTWDGYISHDGSLSPEKRGYWDLDNRDHYTFLKLNLETLEDPVLILGNMHDNNVNMRNWTYFYEKACISNKENLITSWFTYRGINLNHNNLKNTGHFYPNNPEELMAYCNAMLGFMKKDEVVLNNHLSQYINLIGLIKSYENDISASTENLFLSECYKQAYEKQSSLTDEELFNIYVAMSFIKSRSATSWKRLACVDKATDAQLEKAFARDYASWVYFWDDCKNTPKKKTFVFSLDKGNHYPSFLKNLDLHLSEQDLGILENEIELDAGYIIQFLPYYREILRTHTYYYGRRDLMHLRLMRGLLSENTELVKDFMDFEMEDFEKAKQKWQEFKFKEQNLRVELEKDERYVALLKKSIF